MTDSTPEAADSAAHTQALGADQLNALEDILEDLRTRSEEVPQWEFCDGFLTALVCTSGAPRRRAHA